MVMLATLMVDLSKSLITPKYNSKLPGKIYR